jgi:hypothetical protein
MVEYNDVTSAFSNVANTKITKVDADGLAAQVTVSDKQAGPFFKTLRVSEFESDAKRVGSRLTAFIPIEEEEKEGLGELFGSV